MRKNLSLNKLIGMLLACSLLLCIVVSPLTVTATNGDSVISTGNLIADLEQMRTVYADKLDSVTLDECLSTYLADEGFISWYEQDRTAALEFVDEGLNNQYIILTAQANRSETVVPFGGVYPNYSTSVSPVCQATTYWCGPAAGVQALIGAGVYTYGLAATGYDGAQQVLATAAGTTSSAGTSVGPLKNAMNSRLTATYGSSTLKYTYVQITSSMDDYTIKTLLIGNSIQQDRPCVVNALLPNLPYYTGSGTGGHYVTISSINSSTGSATIVDPHYNSAYRGKHTVTYSQLKTILSGRYLIYAG